MAPVVCGGFVTPVGLVGVIELEAAEVPVVEAGPLAEALADPLATPPDWSPKLMTLSLMADIVAYFLWDAVGVRHAERSYRNDEELILRLPHLYHWNTQTITHPDQLADRPKSCLATLPMLHYSCRETCEIVRTSPFATRNPNGSSTLPQVAQPEL